MPSPWNSRNLSKLKAVLRVESAFRVSDCSGNPASPVIRARSCSGKRDGESSSRHAQNTSKYYPSPPKVKVGLLTKAHLGARATRKLFWRCTMMRLMRRSPWLVATR